MTHLLLAISLVLGVPDTSRRTNAWRVVDTTSGAYNCALACDPITTSASRDTACINTAITNVSSSTTYREVEVPNGVCLINASLTITSQWGLTFSGRGAAKPGGDQGGTIFEWKGNNTDPLFLCDDCRQVEFKDFSVIPDSTHDLNAAFKTINGAGSAVAPTANRWENVYIDATTGGAVLNEGIWGATDGAGGGGNQENYVFDNVTITGQQKSAVRIDGAQMKNWQLNNLACLTSNPGVSTSRCITSYGCFNMVGGGGGYSALDIDIESSGCPSTITNADFEGSLLFVKNLGSSGAFSPLTITGTRWSAGGVSRSATGAARKVISSGASSGGLTLIGNTIGDDGQNGYAMTAVAATNVVTLSGFTDVAVDMPLYFTTTTTLPGGLSPNTTYYIKTAPTTSTATLAASVGGSTIDITDTGTGVHTAWISNAKPLAIEIGAGVGQDLATQSVLLGNSISSYLRGTDLFPYWFPSTSGGNTVVGGGYENGFQGYNLPLPNPIRMAGSGATVNAGRAYIGESGVLVVGASGTAVSAITGGVDGDRLSIRATGSRTITNSAAIALANAIDYSMVSGDMLNLLYIGAAWHEVGRSGATAEATDVWASSAVHAPYWASYESDATYCHLDGTGDEFVVQATTFTCNADINLGNHNLSTTSGDLDIGGDTSVVALDVSGVTTVASTLSIKGGGGTTKYQPTLTLASDYVNAPTTGTTQQTLYTFTTDANLLHNNGDAITIDSVWTTAANANAKVPRIKFGGSEVAGTTSNANNSGLELHGIITRSGSSAERTMGTSLDGASYTNARYGLSLGIDTTTSSTITLTGETGTASGDLTLVYVLIEYHPHQ